MGGEQDTFLKHVRAYVEHSTEPSHRSEAAAWLDWRNARLGALGRTPREHLVVGRSGVAPAGDVLEAADAHAALGWDDGGTSRAPERQVRIMRAR